MIVVCGEALVDLAVSRFDGIEAYVPKLGGGPYNIAIGLGRLEVPVAYLGRISRDFFGDQLRARLLTSGVRADYLREGPELTTLAFVHHEPDREPEYSFYANGTADRELRPADVPDGFPSEVSVIHFGSLSLVLEPAASTLEALMAREHGRHLISLDPNVRPTVIGDRAAYLQRLEGWLPSVDLVKVSRADLAWLYPGEPLEEVARRWLGFGPALVVVTRGPDGSTAFAAEGSREVGGLQVEVVDTVGAGDAFMSGLLARLHELGLLHRGRLESLPDELADVLRYATLVSALTVTRAGAEPPTKAEVAARSSGLTDR
jgi:fructokinase